MTDSIVTYKTCPACSSPHIRKSLLVKDYSVSKEEFEIWQCDNCSLRFTQSVPGQQEIGIYYRSAGYISHTDTRQGIVNTIYHLVRRFTLFRKRSLIEKISGKTSGNLLDVGAGTGAFVAVMNERGWKATGVEPDESARAKGKQRYGIDLLPADSLFQLPPQSYDAITLWHVLEHVHDLSGYLGQLRQLLSPEAVLVIAVPNYRSYDAEYYGRYWAAYDVPRHLYHFSPESMRALLQRYGLRLIRTDPMPFDSYYVSLLSERYETGRSRILSGLWRGWISNLKAARDPGHCSSQIYIAAPGEEEKMEN